ncbi:MAG: GTPase Era [Bifidobacteriaceae bacterium]|jgi:GTP-binding protein Era|nr:GTPase Era [Bifidobacteriaceae bacterium]
MNQSKIAKTDNFKSGFVSIVGRPNVGKSTLVNAIIGKRVAIVSKHSGTTQRNVKGIYNSKGSQIVFIDTPGFARPRKTLGVRLNDSVHEGISDSDIVIFCTPADEKIGPGDKKIIDSFLDKNSRKKIACITKADKISKDALINKIVEVDSLNVFDEIVPVTAKGNPDVKESQENQNLNELLDLITSALPNGPKYYDSTDYSTEDELTFASELIRQEVLQGLQDELMHSVAVLVDDDIVKANEMRATIFVERDSQKGIVIGKKGANLGNIRRRSLRALKKEFENVESLNLKVKVAKNWQKDTKMLERFSI